MRSDAGTSQQLRRRQFSSRLTKMGDVVLYGSRGTGQLQELRIPAGRTHRVEFAANPAAPRDPPARRSESVPPDRSDMSEKTDNETLLSEGDLVADYLEELLDIADLDGDIENSVSNGRAHVVIDTEDDRLVGKDGEVLDALQELSRLVVMTETGHRSRLTLDIAGFREKRRLELVALAKDAIAEVVESGEPVRLAPMNAYERKVIHDEVAGAGLTSESEGEPPLRRVVVSTS